MKLSKISKYECKCGQHGTLAFFASNEWEEPCPACGKNVQPSDEQRAIDDPGNRRFSGDAAVSLMHGFHASEVKAARQAMPGVADCIKDDGWVTFRDTRTAQRFEQSMDRVMTRAGVPKHPFSV